MINNISEFITKRWVAKSIIPEEDYELYHYGWFVVLTDLCLFAFTLILGIIFDIVLSSIIFFVTFFFIRRFAGGYHVKTELHCLIISFSVLLLSMIAIKFFFVNVAGKYLLIINLICVIALAFFSPADTPQKPLSLAERKKFKILISIIGIIFLIIDCILIHFEINNIAIPIICAFVLETILVILGRLLNHRLAES